MPTVTSENKEKMVKEWLAKKAGAKAATRKAKVDVEQRNSQIDSLIEDLLHEHVYAQETKSGDVAVRGLGKLRSAIMESFPDYSQKEVSDRIKRRFIS